MMEPTPISEAALVAMVPWASRLTAAPTRQIFQTACYSLLSAKGATPPLLRRLNDKEISYIHTSVSPPRKKTTNR